VQQLQELSISVLLGGTHLQQMAQVTVGSCFSIPSQALKLLLLIGVPTKQKRSLLNMMPGIFSLIWWKLATFLTLGHRCHNCNLSLNKVDWVNKLHVEVIDEEDGGCTIQIDWDDTDPDLEEWSSWGEEGQRALQHR
jgi:hypothetical protein